MDDRMDVKYWLLKESAANASSLFGFLYSRYAAFAVCVDTYYGPITYIKNTLYFEYIMHYFDFIIIFS